MSKLALTGLAAIVILLLGAGVVFAQGNTSFYGGGIRGGMMGNSNGSGTGMMSNDNRGEMRDAINNDSWDEMVNVCQDTIDSYRQGTDNSQSTPQTSAPARGNTGTTGSNNPSTGTTSRTRSMMGSSI